MDGRPWGCIRVDTDERAWDARAVQVIFNHGKESGPDGRKIRELSIEARALGYSPRAIDYRDCPDADARVQRLLEAMGGSPVVLVGSSMGGYVSAVAASERPVAGLFLMAPALYLGGDYPVTRYAPRTEHVHVVHGFGDALIPWQNAARFGEETNATVHLVQGDHRLVGALPQVRRLFVLFLQSMERGQRG